MEPTIQVSSFLPVIIAAPLSPAEDGFLAEDLARADYPPMELGLFEDRLVEQEWVGSELETAVLALPISGESREGLIDSFVSRFVKLDGPGRLAVKIAALQAAVKAAAPRQEEAGAAGSGAKSKPPILGIGGQKGEKVLGIVVRSGAGILVHKDLPAHLQVGLSMEVTGYDADISVWRHPIRWLYQANGQSHMRKVVYSQAHGDLACVVDEYALSGTAYGEAKDFGMAGRLLFKSALLARGLIENPPPKTDDIDWKQVADRAFSESAAMFAKGGDHLRATLAYLSANAPIRAADEAETAARYGHLNWSDAIEVMLNGAQHMAGADATRMLAEVQKEYALVLRGSKSMRSGVFHFLDAAANFILIGDMDCALGSFLSAEGVAVQDLKVRLGYSTGEGKTPPAVIGTR